MKLLGKVGSAVALAGVLVPPALFLLGRLELAAVHGWLLAATALWFASAPLWMKGAD